jgi:sugar lactone lactonase YvrE
MRRSTPALGPVRSEMKRDPFCAGLGFAEGPRWRGESLWVSDIAAREVLRFDATGNITGRVSTPGRPSGLGWLPDGRQLVVMMDERVVLRRDGEEWVVHADLSGLGTAAMNDMVVDRAGVAYVTGLGYDERREEPRATNVIIVRPDGSVEPQRYPVWRPNGCVITSAGDALIVAETRVHRLTRFSINAQGELTDPEPFAMLPRGTWADGICLDAHGGIWVADPKGRACRHVTSSGEIDAEIFTDPVPCIACTLGDSDGRTLYLLVSELGDFDALAERRQGRIEAVRVDVPGGGSP